MSCPNSGPPAGGARGSAERGATAVWLLVILVPVLFGLLGFALDLGILYSVKGELKAAASSMALSAAQKLSGTDASTAAAAAAALLTVENSTGSGNKYYFQGLPVGQTTGSLTSTISDPSYYATSADALAAGADGGDQVSGSQARYVRVTITGQTQLLFWSTLPIVSERNLPVLATAVAGMSAPLCQACGIEPFAVAAIDVTDTVNFGFTADVKYSFAYLCLTASGSPPPAMLSGATQAVSYLMLNRLDPNATVFPDETSQGFRDGAGGLPGSANSAQACFSVNNTELVWTGASERRCGLRVAPVVTAALCGLDARLESTPPTACASIPGIDTLATIYKPDTDVSDYDLYKDYSGDGRRILTVPVVDTLGGSATMTVLGFRQFLLIPAQGVVGIDPGDLYGRFVGMYIGSAAPLKQGRFDGCTQTAGPGKVVLYQ